MGLRKQIFMIKIEHLISYDQHVPQLMGLRCGINSELKIYDVKVVKRQPEVIRL